MSKNILGMFLVLGLLWIAGCKGIPTTPDNPVKANVLLLNIEQGESWLGSPCFKGELQNIGSGTAYDVVVYVFMYEDETMSALLEDIRASVSSNILRPGQVAQLEAIPLIFMLRDVAFVDVKIDWQSK